MSYGRHFKEAVVVKEERHSCKKCRHCVSTKSGRSIVCDKGYVLEPCEEFSDASRQRDYFSNYNMGRN